MQASDETARSLVAAFARMRVSQSENGVAAFPESGHANASSANRTSALLELAIPDENG